MLVFYHTSIQATALHSLCHIFFNYLFEIRLYKNTIYEKDVCFKRVDFQIDWFGATLILLIVAILAFRHSVNKNCDLVVRLSRVEITKRGD